MGLYQRVWCGESGIVDTEITTNWIQNKLPSLIDGYKPEDIFDADETGLFYKLLPNRSLEFKGEACVGGKKAKERLTYLVACNMTGSEKLPLLVIGKFERPRCFKGVKSLPVTYKWNKRSWMTSEIFREWLQRLDKKFKFERRKVLMFVDNCAAHPDVPGLQAITLRFLPPNTTSVLQPCDQGIIYNLKVQYRKLLINYVMECFDKGAKPDINILVAIRYGYAAWKAVDPTVIQKCFRKSGFRIENQEETMDEDDDVPISDLMERYEDSLPLSVLCKRTNTQVSFRDVVTVDADVVATEELTDSEIITDIQMPSISTTLEDSDEDTDAEGACSVVTKENALTSVHPIRQFLETCDGIEEQTFSHLNSVTMLLDLILVCLYVV